MTIADTSESNLVENMIANIELDNFREIKERKTIWLSSFSKYDLDDLLSCTYRLDTILENESVNPAIKKDIFNEIISMYVLLIKRLSQNRKGAFILNIMCNLINCNKF